MSAALALAEKLEVKPLALAGAKPRPVGVDEVMAWLFVVNSYGDHASQNGEMATAIANAATMDPLWPDKEGSKRTAALLVALGCRSGYHPNLIRPDGKAFGLYQIELDEVNTSADPLLIASSASFVAIELVARALEDDTDAGAIEERLAWYDRSPQNVDRSRRILKAAALLLHGAP